MSLNFADIRSGKISYADVVRDITPAGLRARTNELFDTIQSILAPAMDGDVVFVPKDPQATDGSGLGWTISHIITHLTASLEDSAAIAAMLARGVTPEGRLRYETPWESIQTAHQVEARLQESRRMSNAFLDAWPDTPHLELTVTPVPPLGPLNAIGLHMLGVFHGNGHLEQLRDALRQSKEAIKA